jgi:hypothetical protein
VLVTTIPTTGVILAVVATINGVTTGLVRGETVQGTRTAGAGTFLPAVGAAPAAVGRPVAPDATAATPAVTRKKSTRKATKILAGPTTGTRSSREKNRLRRRPWAEGARRVDNATTVLFLRLRSLPFLRRAVLRLTVTVIV